MASTERLQAPSAGICSDASPDYVPAAAAPGLVNLLPGMPGKASMRGSITSNLTGITSTSARPKAVWVFDDTALIRDDAGTKTWRCTSNLTAKTDVTATVSSSILDSRHVRYGDLVYGAIDFSVVPGTSQLASWDGAASALVTMTSAPVQFADIQVFAQRLFVLSGTTPGTLIAPKKQTLFWTDPGATNLVLLATWQDDVSGLTNQIQYDGDDTPVALAGCGTYMAILGTRSVNILTGTGSSNFAIRNLTRNLGCTDINTVLEVDDGFYFMSERGYAFCDGSAVTIVSDGLVSASLLGSTGYTAAMFGHGFVALCNATTCWLFHTISKTWTQVSMDISTSTPCGVYRTNTYPFIWQSGGIRRAELITRPGVTGLDNDGTTTTTIKTSWTSRFFRLASPGQMAQLRRLMFDYSFYNDPAGSADAFRVRIIDTLANELANVLVPAQHVASRRSRFQVELGSAEADAVQLVVTNASTTAAAAFVTEIYDAYLEYEPGRNRPTIS